MPSVAFPEANGLPPNMTNLIEQLANLWACDQSRPRPESFVIQHWDSLVDKWVEDRSLPLFVRKANNNRGSLLTLSSGRAVIPTDNSPASWAFTRAILGDTPSLEDIRRKFDEDQIPIAMILKPAERDAPRYGSTLSKTENPNSAGWKLAHIDGVGLKSNTAVGSIDESVLRVHFCNLMKPGNMILTPLRYAGLGELPEFCKAMGELVSSP